jgi:hypothetical protein
MAAAGAVVGESVFLIAWRLLDQLKPSTSIEEPSSETAES